MERFGDGDVFEDIVDDVLGAVILDIDDFFGEVVFLVEFGLRFGFIVDIFPG
ncbi:MAG: hypothetical protein GY786_01045 [Proteobacteria bacterium]|nr:hypothetical protein [Pseudomonadota bacterium]